MATPPAHDHPATPEPRRAQGEPRKDLQRRPFRPGVFLAWAGVGVLWGLSFASAFSFGLFLMPLALIGTVYLSLGYTRPDGWPGVIGGVSVVAFYLAYLHRHGPGQYCTTGAADVTCTDLLNPWPLLAAGLVLLAACMVVARWWFRREVVIRYRR